MTGIRKDRDIRGGRSGRGATMVEALLAVGLMGLLIYVLWSAFGTFTARRSKLSVLTGASRTLIQQQNRQALKKLVYRLQEGIQILEPAAGKTAESLVFRDLLNRTVRLTFDKARQTLSTERLTSGSFVPEVQLDVDNPLVKPIEVRECAAVYFTAVSPVALFVCFTTRDQSVGDSFMTIVYMSNSRLSQ